MDAVTIKSATLVLVTVAIVMAASLLLVDSLFDSVLFLGACAASWNMGRAVRGVL